MKHFSRVKFILEENSKIYVIRIIQPSYRYVQAIGDERETSQLRKIKSMSNRSLENVRKKRIFNPAKFQNDAFLYII